MEINIRKNSDEEIGENPEGEQVPYGAGWDMPAAEEPITGEHGPAPKMREVAIRVGESKLLFWWENISRLALIIFAGLAPIFFLPFTQLPVAANKELLVFALVLISFFALLGRILIEGRIRYPGHLLTLALAVLVLVWGLSAAFSFNPLTSLIGFWSTPDSFVSIFLFSLLLLSVVLTFSRRDIVISLLVFLASLSVLGIFEIFQLLKIFPLPYSWAKNAIFNPIGSVNDLGVLLAFGLIIASGLMSSFDISPLLKKLLAVAIIIFLFNLAIIDFWAIWLGLALAMVFLIGFILVGLSDGHVGEGLQLVYFRKAWLPSIVLLAALLLLFIPSPLGRLIETPVEVSPNFKSTLNIAFETLKNGRYLLGSGPTTFGNIYNLYKPASINNTVFWSTSFSSGASAMATWAGTLGVLGILSLLFLMVAFVYTGIKGTMVKSASRGIMNVASQAIFIGVLFIYIMWFLYVANFTVMAFAFWGMGLFLAASLYFILETNGRGVFREIRIFTSPPKTFIFSLLIIGLMVGTVVAVYFEIDHYIAEIYFGKAIAASGGGDNAKTIEKLSKAAEFWPYDERYFQNLAQAIFFELNSLIAQKDLPKAEVQQRFSNIVNGATTAARNALSLNPQNPFNQVLLGGIYENLIQFVPNATDFALSAYGAAIKLDPKNPSYLLALARVHIAGNELDKAVSELEAAIDLKADYAAPRILLVQIFDKQGKLSEAIKRATELAVLNPDAGSFFQLGFLYFKNNQFNESKTAFEEAIKLSPNYSNARYFLGLIYDRESRQFKPSSAEATEGRNKAMEQFLKIAELNPDNAEVKQIITNLKAKKAALFGVTPPAPAPQNRTEPPVSEGIKVPLQKLRK